MKAFLTGQVPLAETATSTVRAREDVLAAAAAEVARQESRVDAKAAQLVTLAGTLATLAAAAAGLWAAAPGQWRLWAAAPLVAAAALWTASVVVLLRGVVRPRLTGPVWGSFAEPGHPGELRGMSLADYHQVRVDQLAGLVLRRYRAVRVAVDLLTAGFVPLLGTGLAALATVVLTGGPS